MFQRSDKVVCLRDYLPGDGKHPFHILIPYCLTEGKIYCIADVWRSPFTRGCSGWLCELAGMPMPMNPATGNRFGWPVEWFGLVNRCEEHEEATVGASNTQPSGA